MDARPSAIAWVWLASVSNVAPPMWGVSTTLAMPTSGWSMAIDSPSKWSRAAAARWPEVSAVVRASRSCSAARAVLTNTEPAGIRAKRSAERSPTVSGVTAACTDTTWLSASSSSRSVWVASGANGS